MLKRWLPTFLLVACALPSFAGINQWTIQGPEGGTPRLAWDPVDSSRVYAASTNGLFVSTDGGSTFTPLAASSGSSVFSIAAAPGRPQRLYASWGLVLYRSDDAGQTWEQTFASYASHIAVSASDPDVVYATLSTFPRRSRDGGRTFDKLGSGLPSTSATALAVDPKNHDIAYVGVIGTVYRTTDGGASWAAVSPGPQLSQISALVIDPASGAIFAGGLGDPWVSVNGGATWTRVVPNFVGSVSISQFALSQATSPTTVLASSSYGVIRLTSTTAELATPTGERNVSSVAVDPTNARHFVFSGAMVKRSDDGGTSVTMTAGVRALPINSITVDPRDPAIVYATHVPDVWRSTDRGQSWSHLDISTGQVAVDPFDSQTLYAVYGGVVARSKDGGANWESFSSGLNGLTQLLVPAPSVPGLLYVIHRGALFRKEGEGPWTQRGVAFPTAATFDAMAVDPQASGTVYVAASTGVYKTINGGDTWSAITPDAAVRFSTMLIDPFDSRHLIAAGNLDYFESFDAGGSWAKKSGMRRPFAFDPRERGALYGFDAQGQLLRRTVDGVTARFGGSTPASASQLLTLSSDGRTIYAGGSYAGVWTYGIATRGRSLRR